jgi:TRAP-type uncharacterized transport system fused permease subunit
LKLLGTTRQDAGKIAGIEFTEAGWRMRAIFGVVSLLIVVAIVGLLASRQLKAVNSSVSSAAATRAPAGASAPAPTGTVREQSQQLQQKVANDVVKALEQGARKDESDK